MTSSPATLSRYTRTRLTWQAFLLISYYSYLLNILGPITPFLRDELGLSYTVASLHFSAFAVGIMVSGLLLDRAAKLLGIRLLVWGGALGMAAGTVLLTVGRAAPVTIAAAFAMGLLGVYVVALMNMILAREHGQNSAIAFSESAMVASLFSALAPVAVGFFARTALEWRGALWVILLALPPLWFLFGRDVLEDRRAKGPELAQPAADPAQLPGLRPPAPGARFLGLPFIYWLYWFAIMLAVAIEFCIIFWGADYLERVSGLAKADAALAVSAFLGAMWIGRGVNSRLLYVMRSERLLLLSLLISGAGFLLFWLGPGAVAAVIGLMIAGLGVAGLFPIINALALNHAQDQIVAASGRISLSVGLAIFFLPLLLGRLADAFGIRSAYGLVALLIVLAILLCEWARRMAARSYQPAVTPG